MNTFLGNYVLEEDPNDIDALQYNYLRFGNLLDNQRGIPWIGDEAGSGFVSQQFSWFAHTRERHSALRDLFSALQGRRVPLWLPTYYADFDLVSDIAAGSDLIDVKLCGYTKTGGPSSPNRRYILFHFEDGTRLYREILASAELGEDSERLQIDAPLGAYVTSRMLRRISFIVLSRLDTDEIEFVHHMDTKGVTTVTATFRNLVGLDIILEHEQPLDPDAPPNEGDIVDDPFHD